MLKIIDKQLLGNVISQAKQSPRLRMNYNFHNDLNDKCQRLLNAMEPGTVMPIHHHKVDEVFIVLSGSLRVLTFDDNKNVVEDILLDYNSGNFGVQIPANTWHSVEIEEEGTVIFEVKEGPYIPHEVGGMLQ
jgi:cupin fold WbuC family metalloprotein